MLADIQQAVLDRLKGYGLGIRHAAAGPAEGALSAPSVHCVITQGEYRSPAQGVFECGVSVHLQVVFQDAANEARRMKGLCLILEGIVEKLSGDDLGLDISLLRPVRFADETRPEQAGAGLSVYGLVFNTAYAVETPDPEGSYPDLLSMGIKYYLQPDDQVVDAQDEIDLSESE